jgi:hypothetical protein
VALVGALKLGFDYLNDLASPKARPLQKSMFTTILGEEWQKRVAD